jgi:hypothetical protein
LIPQVVSLPCECRGLRADLDFIRRVKREIDLAAAGGGATTQTADIVLFLMESGFYNC